MSVSSKAILVTALALGAAWVARAGQGDRGVEADTPRAVFTAACTSCHGDDGRGRAREAVGFDTALPDFSDCNFATREPSADWFAIAHEGGPVRGFDHRMPAFGSALSPDQIWMAVEHLRTFCAEPSWPSGDLNQARPMFTEKAFVEDELVFTVGAAVEGPYEVSGELLYERRLGKRSQLEVVVPMGVLEQQPTDAEPGTGGWGGGLGDLALGIKHVFVASQASGTLVSGIFELVLPTGDEAHGLGSGTGGFEPAVAIGQTLGPAGFVHLQAGAEVPAEADPEVELFWRLAYGYTFTQGPFGRSWSPMVELLGAKELDSGGGAEWDVAPQLQISLNARQHIMLGLATRIPLEPGNDRAIGVWAYLLWEWFDGGFGEGW